MPTHTVTPAWQSQSLSQDEIWQNRDPSVGVLTTVEAPTGPQDDRGIRLAYGEVRIFRSGQTVWWRASAAALTGKLHREAHL